LLLWVKPPLSFFLRITGQWSIYSTLTHQIFLLKKKKSIQDWSIICTYKLYMQCGMNWWFKINAFKGRHHTSVNGSDGG
jgi:hypothetical protein